MISFETARWDPQELAVLCFVKCNQELLLIHKRRGLGAGKINAPGGRCEAGERPIDAAIRETQEEVCITPNVLKEYGILRFMFADGYQLEGRVFIAEAFEGIPAATEEAFPFWCPVSALPYSQMWEDDIHWLPHVLSNFYVEANFGFSGDRMKSRSIKTFNLASKQAIQTITHDISTDDPGTAYYTFTRRIQPLLKALRQKKSNSVQDTAKQIHSIATDYGLQDLKQAALLFCSQSNIQTNSDSFENLEQHYLRAVSLFKEQILLAGHNSLQSTAFAP